MATNYSLLSLVSKLEHESKQMVDKQVETDGSAAMNYTVVVRKKPNKDDPSLMAMKVLLKLTNMSSMLGKLMCSYLNFKPN